MRRKKRFGVYSNASIKRCACNYYCSKCKSLCKYFIYDNIDGDIDSHQEMLNSKKNIHRYGFGSLDPGKKFVIYCIMHSFTYRYMRDQIALKKSRRKADLKMRAFEERQYYYEIECKVQKFI